MLRKEDKISRRRLHSSYVRTVISLSLVLFLIGMSGVLYLYSGGFIDDIKERFVFTIFFNMEKNDNVHESYVKEKLQNEPFVIPSSIEYLPTDSIFMEIGWELEDEGLIDDIFTESEKKDLKRTFPHAADFNVKVEYLNKDSLEVIREHFDKEMKDSTIVDFVAPPDPAIENINGITRNTSLILIFFGVLLLFVSIAIINNTIRLALHAKRFTLKTMQLVGASRGFIRRPFVFASIVQGLIASLLSIVFIVALMIFSSQLYSNIVDDKILSFSEALMGIINGTSFDALVLLMFGVLGLGVVITWISTYLSINRLLSLDMDKLY
jgi:cell division transport system permease protein